VDFENVTFRLDICVRKDEQRFRGDVVRSMKERRKEIEKTKEMTKREEMQEGRAVDDTM
jgi:hypothetical protein